MGFARATTALPKAGGIGRRGRSWLIGVCMVGGSEGRCRRMSVTAARSNFSFRSCDWDVAITPSLVSSSFLAASPCFPSFQFAAVTPMAESTTQALFWRWETPLWYVGSLARRCASGKKSGFLAMLPHSLHHGGRLHLRCCLTAFPQGCFQDACVARRRLSLSVGGGGVPFNPVQRR